MNTGTHWEATATRPFLASLSVPLLWVSRVCLWGVLNPPSHTNWTQVEPAGSQPLFTQTSLGSSTETSLGHPRGSGAIAEVQPEKGSEFPK